MNISQRQVGDVTILDVSGKITIGVGDVQVRDAVHMALGSGARNLVLNLKSVTTIDSAGVGELVSAYTTVTNRGGKLKLVNLPSKVNDILQITQLITVFEVYDSEQEALESFHR
jgi:anti-anti-sigma factor